MQRLPFELTPSKKSRLLVNYSNGVIYQDVTKDSLCRVKNVVTLEKRALRLGSDHSADLATELEDVDRFLQKNSKWHPSCWKDMYRLVPNRPANEPNTSRTSRCLFDPEFDYRQKCVICGKTQKKVSGHKVPLIKIAKSARADNIYAAATQLREEFMDVFFRLETDHGCSINMVASDVQYHNVCLQQFIKTASAQPVKQTYEKCFLELANKDANKSY